MPIPFNHDAKNLESVGLEVKDMVEAQHFVMSRSGSFSKSVEMIEKVCKSQDESGQRMLRIVCVAAIKEFMNTAEKAIALALIKSEPELKELKELLKDLPEIKDILS